MPDKYFDREDNAANTETEVTDTTETQEKVNYATAEQFAELKGMVEGLSQSFRDFGQVREQPSPQPSGPSAEEQLAKLDNNLEQLYEQFEVAVQEGKGASKIQREISKLENAKADLKWGAKINDLQSWGTYAIDQLTDKVVATSMPLLDIPEVKKAYDNAIKSMAPDQRMNPEVRMTAYKYAVGDNMDRILDFKMQENLRKAEEAAKTQTPAGRTGRTEEPEHDSNRIPPPTEVLSLEAIESVKKHPKYQGDFDMMYKAQGYKNWEDYWAKVGKAHFTGEEEE